MTDDNQLDRLLSAPLAPLDDDGFSSAVTAQLARRRRLHLLLAWGPLALSLAALAWFVPLVPMLLSPVVALGAALVVLTFVVEPVLAPR